MNELLTSDILQLRPATMQDKAKIFNWLAHSNLTSEMLGPPNFPDHPIPTWEAFDNDYLDYYFDGSQPLKGQCFIILYNGQEIGQINHNAIDANTHSTELDIWLADRQFTGHGHGTKAIQILCSYLDTMFACKTTYIAPSRRNSNAIRSYKKAGFTEADILPAHFAPDYDDAVVLISIQA